MLMIISTAVLMLHFLEATEMLSPKTLADCAKSETKHFARETTLLVDDHQNDSLCNIELVGLWLRNSNFNWRLLTPFLSDIHFYNPIHIYHDGRLEAAAFHRFAASLQEGFSATAKNRFRSLWLDYPQVIRRQEHTSTIQSTFPLRSIFKNLTLIASIQASRPLSCNLRICYSASVSAL